MAQWSTCSTCPNGPPRHGTARARRGTARRAVPCRVTGPNRRPRHGTMGIQPCRADGHDGPSEPCRLGCFAAAPSSARRRRDQLLRHGEHAVPPPCVAQGHTLCRCAATSRAQLHRRRPRTHAEAPSSPVRRSTAAGHTHVQTCRRPPMRPLLVQMRRRAAPSCLRIGCRLRKRK